MLTPDRIVELEQQSYVDGRRPVYSKDCWDDEKVTYEPTKYFNMFMFARAIETEVRKDDTELIRQLLDALETCDNVEGYNGPYQFHDDKLVEAAIIAAKLRLEQPC